MKTFLDKLKGASSSPEAGASGEDITKLQGESDQDQTGSDQAPEGGADAAQNGGDNQTENESGNSQEPPVVENSSDQAGADKSADESTSSDSGDQPEEVLFPKKILVNNTSGTAHGLQGRTLNPDGDTEISVRSQVSYDRIKRVIAGLNNLSKCNGRGEILTIKEI